MCVCVYKHAFCPASPDQSEWVGEGGREIRTSLRDGLALHLTSLEEGAWDQTRDREAQQRGVWARATLWGLSWAKPGAG